MHLPQQHFHAGQTVRQRGDVRFSEMVRDQDLRADHLGRVHALVRNIGGRYYIEDQASTNYTYYEGKQIPEYKPVYLKDGSRFKLSEVEFEFHTGRTDD